MSFAKWQLFCPGLNVLNSIMFSMVPPGHSMLIPDSPQDESPSDPGSARTFLVSKAYKPTRCVNLKDRVRYVPMLFRKIFTPLLLNETTYYKMMLSVLKILHQIHKYRCIIQTVAIEYICTCHGHKSYTNMHIMNITCTHATLHLLCMCVLSALKCSARLMLLATPQKLPATIRRTYCILVSWPWHIWQWWVTSFSQIPHPFTDE